MNTPIKLSLPVVISTGLGSGFAPKAPGTFGTLSCCLVWFLSFAIAGHSLGKHLVVLVVVGGLGWWSTKKTLEELRKVESGPATQDPQFIVIDEWIGFLTASLSIVTPSISHTFCAFLLFRLFDILKPGPVRWAEGLRDEWGVLADDFVAGLFALLILLGISDFIPPLFVFTPS